MLELNEVDIRTDTYTAGSLMSIRMTHCPSAITVSDYVTGSAVKTKQALRKQLTELVNERNRQNNGN